MEGVKTLRDVLLHEMGVGVQSTVNLLGKVNAEHWDYRPADNMRTLKELTEHLVAIPEVDLTIMNEKEQETVVTLEKKYAELLNPKELAEAMKDGFALFKDYFLSLSDEELLEKKTKPFYLDISMTQATWLTETVTHVFHHRAQFFNYLKQLGYDVNMFDLYV